MVRFALGVFTIALAGCAVSPRPSAVPAQQIDPIAVPPTGGAEFPVGRFDEATQSHFRFTSAMPEPRLIAIRNDAQWDSVWRLATARSGPPPPLPRVNFQDEMLLVAAIGPRGSGGYSVTIDRVIDQGSALVVFVRFTSPGPRCGAIAVVTSPIDMVRIPRSNKEVRWQIEQVSTQCD